MAEVIAGTCDECGVAAPHPEDHVRWHQRLDIALRELEKVRADPRAGRASPTLAASARSHRLDP